MNRKLASVQRVSALAPIEGADFIELASIEGWQCIVKKGDFRVGDLGLYLEIDSVPPDTSLFRFLWEPKKPDAAWDGCRPAKYRVRTMRLRGQLSQGLLMPLSAISPADAGNGTRDPLDWTEGKDVTGLLSVVKYDPPQQDGEFRAPFPGYVPQTDEMRVQSAPGALDELRGRPYTMTEKVDGQSATFLIDRYDGTLHCCSRTRSVQDGPASKLWIIARKYGLEAILRDRQGFAIQGEVYGPSIQSNKLRVDWATLAVFDIYDFTQGQYWDADRVQEFCARHALPHVQEIERGPEFAYDLPALLARAEGKYESGEEREGLVVRPLTETHSMALNGRLSFKAISNRFLLKGAE